MKMKRISGALALVLGVTAQTVAWGAPASPTGDLGKNVADQLKAAIADSLPKLGELEPWQKKIFEEEVIPQFQRFIKDYRPSIAGVIADVDLDAIKKYIAFSGQKSLKRTDLRFLVLLRPAQNCDRCDEALDPIKRVTSARLQRRGFNPIWLGDDEINDDRMTGRALEEKIALLATRKNVAGMLVMQWGPMAPEDMEDAHSDEKKFTLRLVWSNRIAGNLPAGTPRELRHEGQLELLENDPFETAAARLLTEAATSLGEKSSAFLASPDQNGEEVTLEIAGIKDFSQFSALRAHITQVLRDQATIVERKLARGKLTLAVQFSKPPKDLRRAFSGMSVPGVGRLAILEVTEHSVRTEVR